MCRACWAHYNNHAIPIAVRIVMCEHVSPACEEPLYDTQAASKESIWTCGQTICRNAIPQSFTHICTVEGRTMLTASHLKAWWTSDTALHSYIFCSFLIGIPFTVFNTYCVPDTGSWLSHRHRQLRWAMYDILYCPLGKYKAGSQLRVTLHQCLCLRSGRYGITTAECLLWLLAQQASSGNLLHHMLWGSIDTRVLDTRLRHSQL